MNNEELRPQHPNATHGRSRTPEHRAWLHIKGRCHCPRDKSYANYGGRGITVCDRWRHSFENFLVDVGERPTRFHSIDRIDTNGHYEPGNVRWAVKVVQARNTRRNRVVEFRGEKRPMIEWAELLGIKYETLIRRVRAYGVDEAMSLPPPPAAARPGNRAGSDVTWATLTDDDVRAIRRDAAAGIPTKTLAENHGVAGYIIRRVVARQTWKRLP